LHIGSTISHYKIVEKLGEGGMGVVYKAEDTKLERTVALKFLAQHLLNDEEAKARFLREAKAAAALHHSNVCPVYEIDEVDGKTFLAMAFLQGETLEQQIAKGPRDIRDALDIGRQVADGLEAAHEAGIVHRDIKPANILVDAKGHATIMDFGLARLTEASRLTKLDTAMGTVAYMSPEQAQGMDVDSRSDIWSLGCVIYEMVSGQRPFLGQYDQALLYEIVHEEVAPLTSIRAGVPMELEFIVGKCLAKDRKDRTATAQEVGRELRTLSDKLKSGRSTILRTAAGVPAAMTGAHTLNPAATLPPDAVVMPRSRQRLLYGLLAAATLAFLGLLLFNFTQAPPPSLPTVEFSLAAPKGLQPGPLSLSPDGRYLAMTVLPSGSLWVRALDSDEWQELAGTTGARYPFWSPDSTQIGFFADGRLKKIAAVGGPPQTIAEANDGRGGSWGDDGTILFAPVPFRQIQQVPAAGGEPTPVTEAAEGSLPSRRFPQWLPGGRHFLYSDLGGSGQPGIYLGSLDGEPPRRLLADDSNPLYVAGEAEPEAGFLLFVREGTLMSQPFDAGRLELSGDAVALPVKPGFAGNAGFYGFAASNSGLLAYSDSAMTGPGRLVWVDRAGAVVLKTDLVAEGLILPRLSPDGQRVAYSSAEGSNPDVWVYDLARETRARLSNDSAGFNLYPIWSPDGRQVAFSQTFGGLVLRSADGSGAAIELPAEGPNVRSSDWSSDSRFLLYGKQDPVSGIDLWSLERTGSGEGDWQARPFLATPSQERDARLAPNGRYVAYSSDESGRDEVYVQPFPDGGQRTTVSTEGGTAPVWSRNGSELLYVDPADTLVAVDVSTAGEFTINEVVRLFHKPLLTTDATKSPSYDVSLDGQRFLVTEPADGEAAAANSSIRFVQNWSAKYLPQH
jgi:serine/threonine protein kinase/Tol biopolymer transport system component